MELALHDTCTGCGACAKACPKQAIEFQVDDEGFPTPKIQKEKCIECGICNRVCPVISIPEMNVVKEAFAAQILDRVALKDSTSGGLFTVFSREIFKHNGVVYGCVWDKEYNAVLTCAENEKEIEPMRGSKYVWSWAGDTFPKIRQNLEKGKVVLFTGLPCQVAGLKKFLRKDYENLFLIDCLCSGTPSPLAFQKYLDTICSSENRENLNLKFRDKNQYGVGVHITYTGKKKKTLPRGEHITNPYYYSFYSHLIDRRSCYQCPYGTDRRVSDLTMCDYWGIANYHKELDIEAGVSGLLVNTAKGVALLDQVKHSLNLVPTKTEFIGKKNNLICDGQQRKRRIPANREAFFSVLTSSGWNEAEKRYLYTKIRFKQWLILKIPDEYIKIIRKFMR